MLSGSLSFATRLHITITSHYKRIVERRKKEWVVRVFETVEIVFRVQYQTIHGTYIPFGRERERSPCAALDG